MKLSSTEKAIIIYVFNQFGIIEGLKSLVDIINKKANIKDEFVNTSISILESQDTEQESIISLIEIYVRNTYGIENSVA